MKNIATNMCSVGLVFALLVCSLLPLASGTVSAHPATLPASEQFSDQELDELLGPIALYPDPLLAQVIPAATFVDQLVTARQVLHGTVNEKLIDNQAWDVSVKSVAHYPQVLDMMAKQKDWTTAVGQAYVYQSTDVMKSIQRLRAVARNSGALVSSSEQSVAVEQGYITIVPAQPQVIYVPVYDPQVVYVSTGPSPGTVALAFGAGLAIGAWLNRDWRWYGPGIYYHGWVGVGWISVNRRFVHINHFYVNRSFTHVNINRTIVNRNITHFRGDLNTRVRTGQHLDINRGNVSRDFNRPPTTTPARTGSAARNRGVTNPATRNNKGINGNRSNTRSSLTPRNRATTTNLPAARTTNRSTTSTRSRSGLPATSTTRSSRRPNRRP